MKNSELKNSLLLSLTSAVRLIEQPADTTLQAPDFDEHGFPVMSGTEDFYALLTNNGQDKIVAMTFAPRTGADNEEIGDKTFFVKITEQFELPDQLLLKLTNDYLICQSDERMRFPDAQVFGVIASSAERGRSDSETAAPFSDEDQRNRFDEFDQTRRSGKSKAASPLADEPKETKGSQRDAETEYDYNADFGA